MKKISTLFKKDPNDLGRVINEIDPQNQWVVDGYSRPMRKYDGSACAIIDSELYKRYDAKHGKTAPIGAIPCQEPDLITGHHPHWLKCSSSKPEDHYFFEGLLSTLRIENKQVLEDGTYELIGEKVQGNPEKIEGHRLMNHLTCPVEIIIQDYNFFESIKQFLTDNDLEGVVFHHESDGRMCKIRKSDFGIER